MTDTDDPHFTLSADHPAFAGHFPGHPIVPGALILDEVIRRASLRHDAIDQRVAVRARRPEPGENRQQLRAPR